MTLSPVDFLKKKVKKLLHSRVHPLFSFSSSQVACFVKRDDELGFGISGNKARKYSILLPYLLEIEYQEAVLIGGPFSNHILSLTQLLIENRIQPTLFLRGPKPTQVMGNYLFLKMLDPSIHWTNAETINQASDAYVAEKKGRILIPEGGTLFPSFIGGLSLPLDILQNEEEMGHTFDHIFIDAGTGWSAAALLLGLSFLQKKTQCHVLLLAGTVEEFQSTLRKLHMEFEIWLGEKCPFPTHFHCVKNQFAPSFGSTNRALFDFIVQTARKEGFFLDPIYSGKLFYHVQQTVVSGEIKGQNLVIHSGGALSLSGFQDRIALDGC